MVLFDDDVNHVDTVVHVAVLEGRQTVNGVELEMLVVQFLVEKTVQTDPLRIVQIDPRFFIKFLPAA